MENSSAAQREVQDIRNLFTKLFDQLLEDLADTDAFTEGDSPSIFFVYAHESDYGVADAAIAQQLIKWLNVLRSKILSDKTSQPRLWSTREDGNAATHDILSNQFCLLPRPTRSVRSHKRAKFEKIGSVDKVVLCCSEVLQKYHEDDRMRLYIDSIKQCYSDSVENSYSMERIKEEMGVVLKKHQHNPEYFHHVLTELAFLEIRSIHTSKPEDIIPVVLNGVGIQGLPYFRSPSRLWLKVDRSNSMANECQVLHKLFFKLLRLLYEDRHTIIDEFEQCYAFCVERMSIKSTLPSPAEFLKFVGNEVVKTLGRLKRHGLAVVRLQPDAQKSASQEFYEVPPRHTSKFIGRHEIMSTLENQLDELSPLNQHVIVLHGMGGQGKTQIALQYCIRARAAKKYIGTFWVDASSEKALKKSFEAIAEVIKPSGRVFQDETSMLAFLKTTLQNWKEPWLMVLDNWDDVSSFSNLRDYIPNTTYCTVLVTSRHVESSRLGQSVEVSGMTECEAVNLLFDRSEILKDEANEELAKKIVERLGCLPLALDQAGAYMRRRKGHMSMHGFLDHYERRKKLILSATPEVWEYRKKSDLAGMEISLSVATTWEMSFRQIYTDDEAGRGKSDLLHLFAFLNHKKISESLFQKYQSSESLQNPCSWFRIFEGGSGMWNSDAFEDVLVGFHDLSLVETLWRETDGSFHLSLHPLVRDWIQIRQKEIECQQNCLLVAQILSTCLLGVYDNQEFRLSFTAKQDFIFHIKAWDEIYKVIIDPMKSLDALVFDVISRSELCFADFSKQCGRLDEARDLYNRVLKHRAHTSWDQEGLAVATKLGWVLEMQGRFTEAESSLRLACELGKTELGPEHTETLISLNLLGLVLTDQGKYEEAAKLNERILKCRESVLGPDDLDTLHSRHNLANNLIYLGLYKRGEELHRQILFSREHVLGRDHFDTLNSICCLASALHHQGYLEEAEKLYQEGYDRSKATLGAEHLDTLDTLYKLAGNILRRGRAEEAEKLCREMMGISERVLGSDHPLLLMCLNELARTLVAQGRYQEAEEQYVKVIARREQVLPKCHPATMVSLNELSRSYYQHGEAVEAERVYQKIIDLDECKLGTQFPKALLSSFGLDSLVISRRRYDRWIENQQHTAESLESSDKDREQNRRLDSLHRLGNLFCDQGRYAEAEKAYRQEQEACKEAWGEYHDRSLLCFSEIAKSVFHQGRYSEALDIREQEALLSQEKVLDRLSTPSSPRLQPSVILRSDENSTSDSEQVLTPQSSSLQSESSGLRENPYSL